MSILAIDELRGKPRTWSIALVAIATWMDEDFLRTETEINVTSLIILPVLDLTMAKHIIS